MEERFKQYLEEKFALVSIVDTTPLKEKQLAKLMERFKEYKDCGYEDEEAYTATINRFTEIDKMVSDLESMQNQQENRHKGTKSPWYKLIVITAWTLAFVTLIILGMISKNWLVAIAAFLVFGVAIVMGDVYYRLKICDGIRSLKSVKILTSTSIIGIALMIYISLTVVKPHIANLTWLILSGASILLLVALISIDKIRLGKRILDNHILLIVINYIVCLSIYLLLGILAKMWLFGIFFILIAIVINLLIVFLRKSN